MAPPPPQSRFLEGSMNDRVSAAPPADFMGPDSDPTDYEKQFAMDWKPPDLDLSGEAHSSSSSSSYTARRPSFASMRSSLTTHTTKTAAAATAAVPRNNGFFSRVGERLGLRRSRSTMNVGGHRHGDEYDANAQDDEYIGGNVQSEFLVPPVPKHHRSASTAAPVPPFDPSKRPTREEITANYQSLLASGFFGTHAIQSTRFAAPGSKNAGEQRLEEKESSLGQLDSIPPSPQREPPPPPPPLPTTSLAPPHPERAAPPPPPPPPPPQPLSMDTDQSTTIPKSPTAIFNPAIPPRSSSKEAAKLMPPPPTPARKLQSPHKSAALSFSSIPYSQTQPGADPIMTARPYRPPPVSLARFSVDIARGRSLDIGPLRGTKRPFTSTAKDAPSFTSIGDHDYDMLDASGGIGVATTTEDEEKHQSGARKLVKRLRKSASKISMDLGRSMSRQSISSRSEAGERDEHGELDQPTPSRTSLSSSVRRSFSWRLGARPGTGAATGPSTSSSTDPSPPFPPSSSFNYNHPSPSLEDHDFFAGGSIHGDFGESSSSLNNAHSTVTTLPPSTPAPLAPAQSATVPHISLVTAAAPPPSPTFADRNRLKKRDIRGRRLRRLGAGLRGSPTTPSSNNDNTDSMEWQQGATTTTTTTNNNNGSPTKNNSRSRSRPRRSEASLFMHAREQQQQQQQQHNDTTPDVAAGGGGDSMEGVEFSFHFPGRIKGPLAVVPDPNRGIPNVPEIPGSLMMKKAGSVRVVRGDLV